MYDMPGFFVPPYRDDRSWIAYIRTSAPMSASTDAEEPPTVTDTVSTAKIAPAGRTEIGTGDHYISASRSSLSSCSDSDGASEAVSTS